MDDRSNDRRQWDVVVVGASFAGAACALAARRAGLRVCVLERKRDPDDRRIVYVCLTTTGLRLIDQTASAHFANEMRLLQSLDDDEQVQLARLLRRLEASIIEAETEHEADTA